MVSFLQFLSSVQCVRFMVCCGLMIGQYDVRKRTASAGATLGVGRERKEASGIVGAVSEARKRYGI